MRTKLGLQLKIKPSCDRHTDQQGEKFTKDGQTWLQRQKRLSMFSLLGHVCLLHCCSLWQTKWKIPLFSSSCVVQHGNIFWGTHQCATWNLTQILDFDNTKKALIFMQCILIWVAKMNVRSLFSNFKINHVNLIILNAIEKVHCLWHFAPRRLSFCLLSKKKAKPHVVISLMMLHAQNQNAVCSCCSELHSPDFWGVLETSTKEIFKTWWSMTSWQEQCIQQQRKGKLTNTNGCHKKLTTRNWQVPWPRTLCHHAQLHDDSCQARVLKCQIVNFE